MRSRIARVVVLILVVLLALPVRAFSDSLSITAWQTGDALNATNLGSRMTSITTWSTNIANDNIKSTAAIVGSKLDLTSGTGRISHSTSVTSDAPVFTSGITFNNVATAFTAWRLTVTNTNSASTSRLIDLRVGSTIIASISRVGQLMLTPQDWASGPSTLLEGAWFNVASATYTDNMTAASGTAPRFIAYAFQRPALAAGNTSVTTTRAATVFIASAPVAGDNMSLAERYALWVDQGDVRIGGNVFASGSATIVGNLTVNGTLSILPANAVVFYNLAACPSGWTEYTALRGRIPVGLPSGGTLAGNNTATALTDQENWNYVEGATGTNISFNTRASPSTALGVPSHQLLACVKS